MTALTTRLLRLSSIVAVVLVVDRVTKIWAYERLRGAPAHSFFGDLLRIDYSENPGAFLSLGASLSPELRFWVFTVLVGSILAFLGWTVVRHPLEQRYSDLLSLILGGGLGNWIDRVLYDGVVVDFLNVGIGGLRTGIFNVADMAITGSLIVLLIDSFRPHRAAGEAGGDEGS